MFSAEILPDEFGTTLKHDGIVPLARFERPVSLMAFTCASLDCEFLHAFAFREKRE